MKLGIKPKKTKRRIKQAIATKVLGGIKIYDSRGKVIYNLFPGQYVDYQKLLLKERRRKY